MALTAGSTYFAAVGDLNGHLHAMARRIAAWEERTGNRIAFVLQTGNFEPHRGDADVRGMPASIETSAGDFPAYMSGEARLPWPLYFVGGSDEPYNYLDGIPDGGAIAPNCFYMGRVGCVELSGCCVIGLSGIYSEELFFTTRPTPPRETANTTREQSYFNEEDIARALDYSTADIVVVHEWPVGILNPGDVEAFEAQRRALGHERIGNEYARMLLDLLAPKLLLCGRMKKGYHTRIELPNGEFANVRALANLEQEHDGVAFFRIDDEREIEEME
jgi:hypothetical protein